MLKIFSNEILVPQQGSNGQYRFIKARRKLITGKKYIYRLKQFAEEKHSAVSLASTNIRSENTKSKAKAERNEGVSLTSLPKRTA